MTLVQGTSSFKCSHRDYVPLVEENVEFVELRNVKKMRRLYWIILLNLFIRALIGVTLRF